MREGLSLGPVESRGLWNLRGIFWISAMGNACALGIFAGESIKAKLELSLGCVLPFV